MTLAKCLIPSVMVVAIFAASPVQAQFGGSLGGAADQVGGAAAQVGGAANALEKAAGTAGAAAGQAAPAAGDAGGLTGMLMQQLGVTEPQATGGAGAIFGLAKSKLSAEDFGTMSAGVPDMSSLLSTAPAVGGESGGLAGGLAGMAGAGGLGSLGSLAGSFSSLGLGADMAGKFVPVCIQYLQGTGGPEAASLLQTALQ
jgi:hypothetical protein